MSIKLKNKELDFTLSGLKHFLYDKNKVFVSKYDSISDIYNELNKNKTQTKSLKLRKLGDIPNVKALCFTFEEQVEYGK